MIAVENWLCQSEKGEDIRYEKNIFNSFGVGFSVCTLYNAMPPAASAIVVPNPAIPADILSKLSIKTKVSHFKLLNIMTAKDYIELKQKEWAKNRFDYYSKL